MITLMQHVHTKVPTKLELNLQIDIFSSWHLGLNMINSKDHKKWLDNKISTNRMIFNGMNQNQTLQTIQPFIIIPHEITIEL